MRLLSWSRKTHTQLHQQFGLRIIMRSYKYAPTQTHKHAKRDDKMCKFNNVLTGSRRYMASSHDMFLRLSGCVYAHRRLICHSPTCLPVDVCDVWRAG